MDLIEGVDLLKQWNNMPEEFMNALRRKKCLLVPIIF